MARTEQNIHEHFKVAATSDYYYDYWLECVYLHRFHAIGTTSCLLPVQYERYTEILADTQIGYVASCGFPSFRKCEIVRPHFVDWRHVRQTRRKVLIWSNTHFQLSTYILSGGIGVQTWTTD